MLESNNHISQTFMNVTGTGGEERGTVISLASVFRGKGRPGEVGARSEEREKQQRKKDKDCT